MREEAGERHTVARANHPTARRPRTSGHDRERAPRLGPALRPCGPCAARRHHHRRAGSRQDDAGAVDLLGVWRVGRGHEPHVRVGARIRIAEIHGASPRPLSARQRGAARCAGVGRDRERPGARPRGMARARGHSASCGACDAEPPASSSRSRPAAALRGVAPVITLVLETATYHGSTALLQDATPIGEKSVAMRGREHEALMAAVGDLLEDAGVKPPELGRIVCGAGPGSFTSLRIAAAIAKGLAVATGATLVPVSSLLLLAASRAPLKAGRVLATLDAMRGAHYGQLFDVDAFGTPRELDAAARVTSERLKQIASDHGAEGIAPHQAAKAPLLPHAPRHAPITHLTDT